MMSSSPQRNIFLPEIKVRILRILSIISNDGYYCTIPPSWVRRWDPCIHDINPIIISHCMTELILK